MTAAPGTTSLRGPGGVSEAGVSKKRRTRRHRSVTKAPFERALVRKSEKALKVARLALNAGDNDSAVSRSYYAMFDIARAALLRAGVAEDKLPRTHSGVIEAFRRRAVESGKIDRQLARRAESMSGTLGAVNHYWAGSRLPS